MKLMEKDAPKVFQELEDSNSITLMRMSLLGMFDSIENFAKSAKMLINKSYIETPGPALRILINATVTLCASAEKIISKLETREKEEQETIVPENLPSVAPRVPSTEKVVAGSTESIDEEFSNLINKFKKSEGGSKN